MAFCQLLYHIIFRTKNSAPTINQAHEESLYRYIWGYCKNKNAFLHRIGGMEDHIHILVEISPTQSIADFVKELKNASNKFLKDNRDSFPSFNSWNVGYCCLTYSLKDKDTIKQYIMNQKEHHKKINFRDELINLLKEYGIDSTEHLNDNV